MAQLPDGVTAEEAGEAFATLDFLAPQSIGENDVSLGWVTLHLSEGVNIPTAIEALSESGLVTSAQPNYVYYLEENRTDSDLVVGSITDLPNPTEPAEGGKQYVIDPDYYQFVNDPMTNNQMNILSLRSPEAYRYTHDASHNPTKWVEGDGNPRPAIAIIDTGCQEEHEDLHDNIVDYYDAVARKSKADGVRMWDIDGHGTHVAGIASAVTNNGTGIAGTSFNASLVPVKVFKKTSRGTLADSADILTGYQFIIENQEKDNIRVANMSLGSTTTTTDADDKALLEAVDLAHEHGILTTISAGNSALSEGGAYSDFPSDFAPNSIGVIDCSVMDVHDNPQSPAALDLYLSRSSYSNYNMPNTMNKQVSALGDSVLSTIPYDNYGRKNGTSMASPDVASVAALALSVNSEMTPDELKSLIFSTCIDADDQSHDSKTPKDQVGVGFDDYTGFGYIDAYNAVIAADKKLYIKGPTILTTSNTTANGEGPSTAVLSIPEDAHATEQVWQVTSSTNPNVITVDPDSGAITAQGAGRAIVSVTCSVPALPDGSFGEPETSSTSEQPDRTTVTLNTIVTVFDATMTGTDTIQYGQTASFGLSATPNSGTWKWESDNPNVTVSTWGDEKTGKVTVKGNKVGETATITATLTSDRSIKLKKTVTVSQADISNATITLNPTKCEYDGKAKTPAVTVKIGSTTLRQGTDYTVSYANNQNVGNGTVTVSGTGNYTGVKRQLFAIEKNAIQRSHRVQYQTHVQNVGWQGLVRDGATSGTSGRSLRLEGIKASLQDRPYAGSIRYRTHVQNIGWEPGWRYDGAMSGTSGRSLRLEAIQIELTGEMTRHYDVYYRVHCQNIGWMGWAKNGAPAGTAGFSYRLEAIQIRIVPKGASAPGSTAGAFRNSAGSVSGVPDSESGVLYRTHVQNVGWQNYMRDGEMSGTSGRSLRLEGINVRLGGKAGAGGVRYRTHVQNVGWQDWKRDGAMSGTSGRSLRLEAIQIELVGAAASKYDVYYRVHCQNLGWMGWAKNGAPAGSAGYAYRLEGIQVKIVPKGSAPPGSTANAFRKR